MVKWNYKLKGNVVVCYVEFFCIVYVLVNILCKKYLLLKNWFMNWCKYSYIKMVFICYENIILLILGKKKL